VKLLNGLDPPFPPLEVVAVRMFLTYIGCIAYMLYYNVPYPFAGPPEVRMLLAIRGVSGFFGLFGIYYSLQYLSVSDTVVLTFLIPSTTALVGYYFMNERYSRGEAIACVCSFVGVILIARPSSLFGKSPGVISSGPLPDTVARVEEVLTRALAGDGMSAERGTPAQRLSAVIVSLIGVVGATGAFATLRQIGTRAHPMHSLSAFSLYSTIVALVASVVSGEKSVAPFEANYVLLLVSVTIFGFITQLMLVYGLRLETAARGSLGVYAQILFAAALERVFFRVEPVPTSVLGGVIIVVSAVYVALSKSGDDEPRRFFVDDEALFDAGEDDREIVEMVDKTTVDSISADTASDEAKVSLLDTSLHTP